MLDIKIHQTQTELFRVLLGSVSYKIEVRMPKQVDRAVAVNELLKLTYDS